MFTPCYNWSDTSLDHCRRCAMFNVYPQYRYQAPPSLTDWPAPTDLYYSVWINLSLCSDRLASDPSAEHWRPESVDSQGSPHRPLARPRPCGHRRHGAEEETCFTLYTSTSFLDLYSVISSKMQADDTFFDVSVYSFFNYSCREWFSCHFGFSANYSNDRNEGLG